MTRRPEQPPEPPEHKFNYYLLRDSIVNVLSVYLVEAAGSGCFDPEAVEMNLNIMLMAERAWKTDLVKASKNVEEAKQQLRIFIKTHPEVQNVLRLWERDADSVCAIIDTIFRRYFSN